MYLYTIREYEFKTFDFGLKNIHCVLYCVLLTCIITMHYCVLCIIIEYYYC